MSGDWKPFAHAALVDIAAANLANAGGKIIEHLRDALDNIGKAIDAVENEAKEGGAQ